MTVRRSAALLALALALLAACTPRLGYLGSPQGEGATGRQGQVVVSNAEVAFSGPLDSAVAYGVGGSAPLTASIVNTGDAPDRLVSVSSPVADGARITGDTTLPGGHVLAVGSQPGARTQPDTTSVQVTLTGLRQDLRHGMTYPVVFTFAKAGALRLQLPVAVPAAAASTTCAPAPAPAAAASRTVVPGPPTATAAPGC